MNAKQVIEFAVSSASSAYDQRDAYSDAIASYRDNLIDTMNDEKVDEYNYRDALAVYDAEVKKLFV